MEPVNQNITKPEQTSGIKLNPVKEPKKPNFLVRGWRTFTGSFPYIGLQLKLAFTPQKRYSKGKTAALWIVRAIIYILAMFLIYLFLRGMCTQTTIIPPKSLSIFIFTTAGIVLLIYSISIQTKRLYKPNDLRIISTFPISPFQRYLGEIITIFVRMELFTFIFLFPILILYGVGSMQASDLSLMSAGFVFSSLFATLLTPLVPFAISLVISVPFMLLGDFLKNKHIAKLVIFVIIFAGLLVLYAFILNFITETYIHMKLSKEVYEAIRGFLDGMNKWYNPCYYASEVCIIEHIGANFGYVILLTLVFGAIGFAITRPLYNKFAISGAAIEGDPEIKHYKLNNYNAFTAIFMKELKQILRTPAYAYFYLGVAVSMPILTYLVSGIVMKLGQAQIGTSVFWGLDLLILTIIISLIGSYSGNVISREGKQFYISKVAPIEYRKQILAKTLVNFVISFVGLLLCIVVLAATAMQSKENPMGLTGYGLAMLFGICTLFLIGITFNGVNIDLARPRIDLLGGSVNETNIIIQLAISIVIGALVSVFAIVVDAVNKSPSIIVQSIILGVMLAYALINFLVFFFTCNKKYTHIELK